MVAFVKVLTLLQMPLIGEGGNIEIVRALPVENFNVRILILISNDLFRFNFYASG